MEKGVTGRVTCTLFEARAVGMNAVLFDSKRIARAS